MRRAPLLLGLALLLLPLAPTRAAAEAHPRRPQAEYELPPSPAQLAVLTETALTLGGCQRRSDGSPTVQLPRGVARAALRAAPRAGGGCLPAAPGIFIPFCQRLPFDATAPPRSLS